MLVADQLRSLIILLLCRC